MMEVVSDDFLIKRIKRKKEKRENIIAMWDQIIPEQIPSAYYDMGLQSRGIGIYTLLLRDKEESLKWFEQATKYYFKRIETSLEFYHSYLESDLSVYLEALYASIFSGNTDLVVKVANGILGMDIDYPRRFPDVAINFYYAMSLGSLILDKSDNVSDFTEKLVELNKTKKSAFFEGASEFIEGMQTDNANAVREGVNKVLEVHEKRITKGPPTDDELVSISGTAFLLLARNKGIEITPTDIEEKYRDYIPWNLFD